MRLTNVLLLLPLTAFAQAPEAPPAAPPDPAGSRSLIDDREATPLGAGDAALPEKILEVPPPEAVPAVSIRTESSGDVVEEYRLNGQIYMVRVRPQRGLPYTLLDTNGDGRLDASDGEGPVRPVYWTLYEWE